MADSACGRSSCDPGKQLPIAARPTMLPGGGDVVTRRKILEDLDVGHQSGAGKNAFQQVVAENGAFGDTACERGLERIHVVNTLAAEGALLIEILINVRNG